MSKKHGLYAQATKSSLENAEQWIKDAKLLIKNSSFGHASALLRFACEEIAKAHVCWLTSEKIIPIENKVVQDVFRYHKAKNSIILAMLFNAMFLTNNRLRKQLVEGSFEPSEEDIIKAYEVFEDLLVSTEKMRQKTMYVDANLDKNQVETPLTIEEKEVKSILWVAEIFLKIVKQNVEEFSETDIEELRETFKVIPKEAWKTGEIPIEWLRHNK